MSKWEEAKKKVEGMSQKECLVAATEESRGHPMRQLMIEYITTQNQSPEQKDRWVAMMDASQGEFCRFLDWVEEQQK